jgi:hypothetical protein
MISTTDILISTYSVGTLTLDGPGARGEGGSHDPRLVIPTTIAMAPKPSEKQLAVTELECALHWGPEANDQNQIGPTVSRTFLPELHAISVEKNPNNFKIDLRFGLTPVVVERLDTVRQASPNGDLRLQVRSKVIVSLIYQISGEATTRAVVRPIPDFPFGLDYGIASTLAHFWNSSIYPFALEIPRSSWVERVLPGLGVEHVRILEVGLPRTVAPLPSDTLRRFDAARTDLDNGRGRECVQKLRDVRYAIEQHLGATKASPVAMKIAAHRGLPPDAVQVRYLDAVWKALADLTSDPHHDASPVSSVDARSALLVTAVLLDYVRAQLEM